ncbi:hypothetical protein [Candidatus Frankia alpina]|uniref:hypothetical protein n=1 Tax=Candidatus Frankia alpina TaxID=2699483 RepID=UPI0013D26C10|nr:hypothetical protein [Candidatus Frankia alpina]
MQPGNDPHPAAGARRPVDPRALVEAGGAARRGEDAAEHRGGIVRFVGRTGQCAAAHPGDPREQVALRAEEGAARSGQLTDPAADPGLVGVPAERDGPHRPVRDPVAGSAGVAHQAHRVGDGGDHEQHHVHLLRQHAPHDVRAVVAAPQLGGADRPRDRRQVGRVADRAPRPPRRCVPSGTDRQVHNAGFAPVRGVPVLARTRFLGAGEEVTLDDGVVSQLRPGRGPVRDPRGVGVQLVPGDRYP